ncbi:hypothetical protein IACHDJAJ_00155 [Aeromonas phage vB_AdhS_TS3]|nr:hypothetical protein IACHDJAJ_00155 [Aeromonas phage vB_AdhS_TS3]
MRKKLKRRFIDKTKRKGRDLETCLLFAKLSDSLQEAKEMARLEKVKNQHKLRYEGPYKWLHWEMYSVIVKRTGRRLGSTSQLP